MSAPQSPDRFNEDAATYTVKGGDAPDLDAGVAAIRNVLKTLPARPGVYRMQDARGYVLYVGKARALKSRVNNYTQVDRLPKRLEDVKITNIKEDMNALRRNAILVDGADDKYMLQIFMLDAMALYGDEHAGPFFYEIIQREGDRGFGYGNFRALFESIEAAQRSDSSALEVVG